MTPKIKILKICGLIIFLFLFSCKTSFYSEKVINNFENTEGIIYALPKTKLIVSAEITKEIKQKGIFSEYTNLYFNAKNAVKTNETKFYLSDISVKTIPVADSSKIFRIVSLRNINPLLLNLSKDNFISGINLSDIQAGNVNKNQNINKNEELKTSSTEYSDISFHSVREVQFDTIYKEVLRDSVMIKIPIIKKKEVYKSTAKQAKETAEIIFNLRDDRYALLTGENDGNNFPDGKSLNQMLQKLSELEKNYMSLFTGREMKITKTYQFEFIPDNNLSDRQKTLFYFSDRKGVVNDTAAVPVILNFQKKEFAKNVSFLLMKKNKGIIYRLPGKAEAIITYKNKMLYKKEIVIPQTGTLNLIPANLFKEKITVEFYPESGALKRISK